MLAWCTVLLIAAAVFVLRHLPRPLVGAYRATFIARHGVSVQLGLVVLATMTLTMLFATLVVAERKPVMEAVDAGVVVLTLAAGALDLYFFTRR